MAQPMRWTPELVTKFWRGVSATRLSELSFAKLNSFYLLELIQPHLQSEGRHLDFGAGEGDLLSMMLDRGYRTAAFEPAGRGLAVLQEAIRDNPRYLGAIKDGESEPFDVVLMVEVIEHLLDQDLPAVLDSVSRLVKNDGTLIVTTPNAEDLDLASVYCPTCDTVFHRWQHMRSFTEEMLDKVLEQYGFKRVIMHRVDFSNSRIPIEELKFIKELILALYEVQSDKRMSAAPYASMKDRIREYSQELERRSHIADGQQENGFRLGNESHLIYVGKKS